MEKKIARAVKVYPFFYGLSSDLLFYIAIDTLFLVSVKNFTEAQIIPLTTISAMAGILVRFPILWLVHKMGNTTTIRIGAFCLLLSSVLITVGPTFEVVAIGRCLRNVTVATNDIASTVALENNLEEIGCPGDFIKYRTKGNTYYASITLAIALVATYIFNFNHYLPMICCIVCALGGAVLSFFVGDYTDNNKAHYKKKRVKTHFSVEKFALLAMVAYGLLFTVFGNGIGDAKLFIQQDIMKTVSLEMTATIVGVIYFLSRCARLLSNMFFVRLYNSLRLKTGILLAGIMLLGLGAMLAGVFFTTLPIKIFLMGVGYVMMLFAGDPVRHYIQQVFVVYEPKEQHRFLFATMGLVYQICSLVSSAIFSAILLYFTMNSVMFIMLIMVAVALVVMCMLYRQLSR